MKCDTALNILGVLLILMTFIGAFNSIVRYIGRAFNQSLTTNALLEIQWYLFSVVFLLGIVVAYRQGRHIRVDVFYNRFSFRTNRRLNILFTVLLLLPFAAFLMYFTGRYALRSIEILEQSSNPDGLARYPLKVFMPVSFGLLLVTGLYSLYEYITKRKYD